MRDKAKRLGWEELLRLTLRTCQVLFDTSIPPHFSLGELPSWLKPFPSDPFPPSWQVSFVLLHLLNHPSDKFRYLMRLLFTPTLLERRLLYLPSSLGFVYYFLRPLRLGCKWSWWLVQASFRGLALTSRHLGK